MSKRIVSSWPPALFLFFLFGTCLSAHAQSSPSPAGSERGIVFYESFQGDSNSDGQVMVLSSSATYRFNQHFSIGVGIPIYFDHPASSTGATSSSGIGNVFATVRAVWKSPVLNYGTSLTGAAPTGDSNKGLSTGHATFDWDNRVNHDLGVLTPFFDLGAGNSITDTRYFLRPFSSYGYLAHFEAGTNVDLSHSLSLTLSVYDIAPWGTQTVFSRVVAAGSPGKSGSVTHGRAFENNHLTTGTSSLTSDDGFNAYLSFNPKPYLDLDLGYTRSVRYALNSISFGIGVNLNSLFGKSNQSVK